MSHLSAEPDAFAAPSASRADADLGDAALIQAATFFTRQWAGDDRTAALQAAHIIAYYRAEMRATS